MTVLPSAVVCQPWFDSYGFRGAFTAADGFIRGVRRPEKAMLAGLWLISFAACSVVEISLIPFAVPATLRVSFLYCSATDSNRGARIQFVGSICRRVTYITPAETREVVSRNKYS